MSLQLTYNLHNPMQPKPKLLSPKRPFMPGFLLLVLISMLPFNEQAVYAQVGEPFAVEYYYKVKWGHFSEFMELYKKNHYPILLKLKEMGRIVDMQAAYPFYHGAEAARWDFRFTIVWKDAEVAHDSDFDDGPIIAELYPDQELFKKEEQRRFELLIEHMDIPIVSDDFSEWPTSP